MNHLIVYCHPNPASFNHAVKETARETLEKAGHKVVVRDLYKIGFEPVLKPADFAALQSGKVLPDVKTEQDHIAWAECITFIYPVWWVGLPAMLKGYIDRVFSHGFAFKVEKGQIVPLLKGKKAVIFNTTGTPKEVYEKSGMLDALKKTSDAGIMGFCGVDVASHQFLCAVPYLDDAARKKMLGEVKTIVSAIN